MLLLTGTTDNEVDYGLGCDSAENKMDERQKCRCDPGSRISVFKSEHDHGPEDRIWKLECGEIKYGDMCVSFSLLRFLLFGSLAGRQILSTSEKSSENLSNQNKLFL